MLVRYEGALNRTYDRAFKQLLILQRPAPVNPANSGRAQPEPAGVASSPESVDKTVLNPEAVAPSRPGLGSFRPGPTPASAPPPINQIDSPEPILS